MWTLFGKPLQASKGVVDDMAGYLDDASGAADGLAGGAGDASDGLGKAGKAAKNLKKQLQVLPFDELNQLAKDTEAAGSGGSGGAGGGGGGGGLGAMNLLGDLDTNFDLSGSSTLNAINKWAEKIKRAFLDRDWKSLGKNIANFINMGFGKLYEILDWKNVGPKVYGFVRPFQATFNSIMEYIDWDLIGRTFGRGLNTIVYTLRTWITGFNWRMYGTQIATGMNSMLDEWDAEAFGKLIADKFQAAWDFFGGWVSEFDFELFGEKLKESVIAGLKEFKWDQAGISLAEFFNGISTSIIKFFENGDVATEISTAFSTFVNNFLGTFDSEKAKEAMKTVKDSIKTALFDAIGGIDKSELLDEFVNLLGGLPWETIGTLVGIKIGADLVKGLIGVAFTKSILTGAMTSALGTGGTAAASTAAGGGAATAAAAGGALTVGSIVGTTLAIAGITVGAIELGKWLKKKGIGQLNTEGNKKKAAQTVSEGQAKNNQGLEAQGLNAAGYNTKIMTVPQQNTTANTTSTVTVKATQDPSFNEAFHRVVMLQTAKIPEKVVSGDTTPGFDKAYLKLTDQKKYDVSKNFGASESGDFKNYYAKYIHVKKYDVSKNFAGKESGGFLDKYGKYTYTKKHDVGKNFKGSENGGFLDKYSKYTYTKKHDVIKGFTGKDSGHFVDYMNKYDNIDTYKKVTIDIAVEAAVKEVTADIDGALKTIMSLRFNNAKGGLFNGPAAFQVFGEAGAEAAIPLERRSTMRRIANAIVDSGGMQTSSNTGLAMEIAAAVAPYIMDAVSETNRRPVQVNATLYTENDEVLARAVTRGQRSIDKRYNPVSQFSY